MECSNANNASLRSFSYHEPGHFCSLNQMSFHFRKLIFIFFHVDNNIFPLNTPVGSPEAQGKGDTTMENKRGMLCRRRQQSISSLVMCARI